MINSSEGNKATIADTAIYLFSIKGYDGVSVQEICDAAEITKPTLYYYFKSKRGLLEYITEEYGKKLVGIIKESLTYEHDFLKSLTKVLKAELAFARDNLDFFYLHNAILKSPKNTEQKSVYSSVIQEIDDTFLEFFTSSAREFGNMRGKEALYSEMFDNNVISSVLLIIEGTVPESEQIIHQIIHASVYGFAD